MAFSSLHLPAGSTSLRPEELAAVTGGQWVDLCKLPEELA